MNVMGTAVKENTDGSFDVFVFVDVPVINCRAKCVQARREDECFPQEFYDATHAKIEIPVRGEGNPDEVCKVERGQKMGHDLEIPKL